MKNLILILLLVCLFSCEKQEPVYVRIANCKELEDGFCYPVEDSIEFVYNNTKTMVVGSRIVTHLLPPGKLIITGNNNIKVCVNGNEFYSGFKRLEVNIN